MYLVVEYIEDAKARDLFGGRIAWLVGLRRSLAGVVSQKFVEEQLQVLRLAALAQDDSFGGMN